MAIFGVAYSPLRVSVGMQVTEGVLTQEYDPGSSEYMPDRRIRPTAVLPVVRVSDPSGFLEDGAANTLLADIFWYEGEASDGNVILDNDPDYDIDRTSETQNRGRITVYKNVPFNQPLTLVFKAVVVDMVGGKVRRKANVMGSVNLTTSTASTAPLELVRGYPRGNLYNIMDKRDLRLSAKLMAGTEEVPSAFWWYKKEGNKLTPLEDLPGAKTGELTVPVDNVGRKAKYVVKAQDCRKDLKALQDEWLDGELERIREWPRNLIAKQYMMDWNEVKAGTTVKGSDADGEYYSVKYSNLYNMTNKGTEDVFFGKISFKEDTMYVLKVKGRIVGDNVPDQNGRTVFRFAYTDGTYSNLLLNNTQNTVSEISKEGKTVSHINSYYTAPGSMYIYEISLTEYGGAENLIERLFPESVSQYATVEEQSETLFEEKTWKVTSVKDGQPPIFADTVRLTQGKTYTMSAYVKTGTKTGSSFGKLAFYDRETPVNLASKSITEELSEWTQISCTFTADKNYDDVGVYFYAGSVVGCETYFSCMKLEEGDTATEGYVPKWIPSAEDLAAEAGKVTLPEGYRPSSQGETVDGEYDLALRMPGYTTRVVTPWGDDKGVVMLPPSARLFPAWIQVDTPAGTLDNPEAYFSADWGNGLKGMRVLLDAEQIGTGTMVVEPEVLEDLSKARYGVGGASGDALKLETVVDGTKLVVEFVAKENGETYFFNNLDSLGNGCVFLCIENYIYIYFCYGGTRRSITRVGNLDGHLHRIEMTWNSDESLREAVVDGKEVALTEVVNGKSTSDLIIPNMAVICLAEIYSPDGTLLHKWDMDGETDDERLADKAETDNPINLTKESGFKLTPI